MTPVRHGSSGQVDEYGRVTMDPAAAFDALYAGMALDAMVIEPGAEVEAWNERWLRYDRPSQVLRQHGPLAHSPAEEHARRAQTWLLGNEVAALDVRAFLLDLCPTPQARARIEEEMVLFEERGLVPLLRAMICLVADLRSRKVVWGVGRGSSVASYALFLIGVHRVNPLLYDLDVREFLKTT